MHGDPVRGRHGQGGRIQRTVQTILLHEPNLTRAGLPQHHEWLWDCNAEAGVAIRG